MPRFPRVPTFWPSESKLPLSYPTPTSKAREKRPGDEVDPTPPFSALNLLPRRECNLVPRFSPYGGVGEDPGNIVGQGGSPRSFAAH